MSPFEIIGYLSTSKESKWEDIGDKDYNSFMVNRGMSYYPDCIMLANEMNSRYSAPKQFQHDFYLSAIDPKKKRFSKWSSSKKDSEIQLVAEYFNISILKATSVRQLLTPEQMAEVTQKMDKGGTHK